VSALRFGPLHPASGTDRERLAKTSLDRDRQLELYRWLKLNRMV
jgi:hypothetical protein